MRNFDGPMSKSCFKLEIPKITTSKKFQNFKTGFLSKWYFFKMLVWRSFSSKLGSINQKWIAIRGGVESNRTNFELIFLEFFELKMYFRINRIENFSNRTNRIILPSNRIEFRIERPKIFRIFRIDFQNFRIEFESNCFRILRIDSFIEYFDYGQSAIIESRGSASFFPH